MGRQPASSAYQETEIGAEPTQQLLSREAVRGFLQTATAILACLVLLSTLIPFHRHLMGAFAIVSAAITVVAVERGPVLSRRSGSTHRSSSVAGAASVLR